MPSEPLVYELSGRLPDWVHGRRVDGETFEFDPEEAATTFEYTFCPAAGKSILIAVKLSASAPLPIAAPYSGRVTLLGRGRRPDVWYPLDLTLDGELVTGVPTHSEDWPGGPLIELMDLTLRPREARTFRVHVTERRTGEEWTEMFRLPVAPGGAATVFEIERASGRLQRFQFFLGSPWMKATFPDSAVVTPHVRRGGTIRWYLPVQRSRRGKIFRSDETRQVHPARGRDGGTIARCSFDFAVYPV